MQKSVKYVLLLFALIINRSSYGQHVIVVAHPPSLKSHNGYAVLLNADTLYGKIKLDQFQKSSLGVTIETDNGKKFISVKNLTYIRLFDYDSTLITTKYTEYRRLT